MFTIKFDTYVCTGDTIETVLDGFTFTARIEHDIDSSIDGDDCHNIDQGVTGCNAEQQEKLLANREAYANGEWFYCGVIITVSKGEIVLDDCAASLWSIEANYPGSDNSYLLEVANELLEEARETAETTLEALNSAIS